MNPASHVRVRENQCLLCGAKLDAIGTTDGSDYHEPKPGDPVLCIKCGATMTWENNRLRPFTDEEAERLANDPDLMKELTRATGAILFLKAAKG
jgi:hypothetical protein